MNTIIVILSLVVMYLCTSSYRKYLDGRRQNRIDELRSQVTLALIQAQKHEATQETRRLEILVEMLSCNIRDSISDGTNTVDTNQEVGLEGNDMDFIKGLTCRCYGHKPSMVITRFRGSDGRAVSWCERCGAEIVIEYRASPELFDISSKTTPCDTLRNGRYVHTKLEVK